MPFPPAFTDFAPAIAPLRACAAVAGRKLMGSAGLRQPAAHS